MFTMRCIVGTLSVGLMALGTELASSQDYPIKSIRIVTGAAGGGTDFMARQVAQGMSVSLGQPVIVENRGGGVVQYEFLSKAPPDGYSLVVAGGQFWLGPLLTTIPYDVERDFLPVSLITRDASVVVVHPSLPVKSIKELIALAKARPGELNYASGVIGGGSHLAAELFKAMAGINAVWIPYKGGGPALNGVLVGEVQMYISDAGLMMALAKSGKLRALAVTSAERSPLAPGLPTVAASGVPGYEAVGLTGMFAPNKTPGAIINRLNREVVRVLNLPDVKERILNAGSEAVGNSPEQFAATIKSEINKWGKVIRDARIKVD